MTRSLSPPEPSRPSPLVLRPRGTGPRAVVLLPLLLALAACSSVPLPPWPSPTGTVTAPPRVVVAPAPAPIPGVVVQPVPDRPAMGPSPASAAPYSAAVAARFPVPSVIYNTPGLQEGRGSFTSNAEIQTWLRELSTVASRSPGLKAAVLPIGQSQRGETLEALVLTRAAGTDAAAIAASARPTVLLIGQQHGDEPAGTEALLVVARELTQGLLRPVLDRVNVIIVPRANPDGSMDNKRVTTGGLDMNRDHLLLNTPEAQALARLARDYHPTVVVDAHEYTVVGRFLQKFGTVQKYDALLQYATTANIPEFLTKASEEWYRRPLVAALKRQGLSTEWYYTTSTDLADKTISMGGTQPDTGRNVSGLKNAVSLLIETRGVGIGRLHIQRRVHTHVTAISSVLTSTAQRASELGQLQPYVEKEMSALACKEEAVVEAGPTLTQQELVMLDPVTGADKALKVQWNSALTLRKIKTRVRPCGYWLSAGSRTAVERLRLHGVQVLRVAEPASMLGDLYRETASSAGVRQDVRGSIADAAQIVKVDVALVRGVIDAPSGSYYVPMNQPLANLVIAALEPDTQSSFFANRLLDSLSSTARVMSEPTLRTEELP
ncbi:MAG: peptidase M14 [Polaromonas sp. 39-63-25]|nr:MAG: peptidase M14 [Polaromonas sp. 35-63-35]OYZ22128.1 MAG: peptidase M14 [Polaromonas sp. 16-63-31]OYZ80694.1 MAG: peptidase M14 [Polaromonas sp. 24-63-21]OZA51771.1 MAG: peptidase M14 [Polaromonas sp. 17-63-33]OZA90281.1 MAG: peptidase M14 [Polaromonas sp. 39-63-25]